MTTPKGWNDKPLAVERRPCKVCLKAVPVTRTSFGWKLEDHDRYARPGVYCPGSGRTVR